MLVLTTFSIAARCPRTGMLGVAVSSAVPGVGSLCPFAFPKAGAVATQSFVNPYLGIDGLDLLRQGLSAEEALDRLIAADPGRAVRQVGVVGAAGRAAAYSGAECVGWFGHRVGTGYTVQGNMLAGEAVIQAMAEAFESSEGEDLPERLARALEGGQRAGGDKRGRQSAALLVVHEEEYPYLELRVDEHTDPVRELRRVLEVAKDQLVPFVSGLPSRRDPLGSVSEEVREMLLRDPRHRARNVRPRHAD